MRFFGIGGGLLLLVAVQASVFAAATVDQLRADQAALSAAEHQYQARLDQLSPMELTDFNDYISRLRERFADRCAQLQQAGVALPADISCSNTFQTAIPAASIDQRQERSRGEQAGVLDAELQEELGEFDEKLLREQARVKAQAPKGKGRGQGAGVSQTASDETAGIEGEAVDETVKNSEPGKTDTAAGGQGYPQTVSSAPGDIPDGSDDDVVARQMREAAEKESDPVLKERLWEEYRKYKQGTR